MTPFRLSLCLAPLILAAACSDSDKAEKSAPTQDKEQGDPALPAGAAGILISPGGNELGTAQASDTSAGAAIRVTARGLQPGVHGLQLHSAGKCQGPNFVSSGPRLGSRALPNITIGNDGLINQTLTIEGSTVADLRDEDGSSLVIHLNPDNPPADQSGKAGDRIACAVI